MLVCLLLCTLAVWGDWSEDRLTLEEEETDKEDRQDREDRQYKKDRQDNPAQTQGSSLVAMVCWVTCLVGMIVPA